MKKLIPLVLIVVCLMYMWHMYNNIKLSETTAVVKAGEYKDIILTEALVIRDEKAVTAKSEGFFQNSVPNISKVEDGRAVGEFYAGTPDKEVVGQINAINEKIRETQSAGTGDELFSNDIATINNKIEEYASEISALASEGRQSEINKLRKNIDMLLERRASIEQGASGGKSAILAALEAQKAELEKKLGSNMSILYSERSGVFVASADGLEDSLTRESAVSMSKAEVEGLLNRKSYEPAADVIPYPVAKVVDNSSWIIAFVTNEERASQIAEVKRVNVKFPGGGAEEIICRYIGSSEADEGDTAVFLEGTREIEYLLKNRRVSAEIYVDDYEGLEIPADALKKHEGKDVVEVRSGKETAIKPVEVLFKNDEIAIVKEDNTKENSLLLYEEVVTP